MKANKAIIIIISILVPMLVAFLFVNTEEQALVSDWIYRLPHLNAPDKWLYGCYSNTWGLVY